MMSAMALQPVEKDGADIRAPAQRVCHVCQRQVSKYQCPKCRMPYCSLPCYKSHGEACTESFYREQVEGALKGAPAPDDDLKRKTMDILRREAEAVAAGAGEGPVEEEGEEGEEEAEELSPEVLERLHMLAVSDDADLSPEDLPPPLRREFEAAVASGAVTKDMAGWRPWWTSTISQHQVDVKGGLVADADAAPAQPKLPFCTSLSPAVTLEDVGFKGGPSPQLLHHAIDIVYAYVYTLTLYNGDWGADADGAAGVLVALSPVLSGGAMPTSPTQAIRAGVSTALRTPAAAVSASTAACRSFAVAAIASARDVFTFVHYLRDALADAHALVASVVGGKSKAKRVAMKLRFFVAWATGLEQGDISRVRGVLDALHLAEQEAMIDRK